MPDVEVVMTRTTDIYHSVVEKAKIANAAKGDLFICIHTNSADPSRNREIIGHTTKSKYVKKNGKMVKVTKPAVSDFRVNLSSDGSTISIWECDDIKAGEFIEVQKVLISESWDVSDKDSSNNVLWEIAMNDPRHVNWTWACPAGTGNRTCYRVEGLK